MTTLTRPVTVEDLAQFPDDGRRYEIIGGELSVLASPSKKHQRLSRRLSRFLEDAADAIDAGEVFYAPVDVRFSPFDQVQPDIIFIRRERAHIYQGNTVFGPPDLLVEIFSPTTRRYDETAKMRLYAAGGVPEVWLADPDAPSLRVFVLRDGGYVEISPDSDGRLGSPALGGLVVDPAPLLAGLDD